MRKQPQEQANNPSALLVGVAMLAMLPMQYSYLACIANDIGSNHRYISRALAGYHADEKAHWSLCVSESVCLMHVCVCVCGASLLGLAVDITLANKQLESIRIMNT